MYAERIVVSYANAMCIFIYSWRIGDVLHLRRLFHCHRRDVCFFCYVRRQLEGTIRTLRCCSVELMVKVMTVRQLMNKVYP